jgi:ABC-type Na+ efflux pump permease subunit
MNWAAVREIFAKDIQETIRNRYVFMSISVLPIIIIIENVFTVSQILGSVKAAAQLGQIIPLTSLIVLIIPSIVTALLASTSVVIEKNNRSLEPLLSTPITDTELLLGKCLASFIPAMVVSYGTFILLILVIDAITMAALGVAILPTTGMIYQLVLVPILGLLSTFVSLLVSTRIKDVRAAQQVATLAVLPVLAFAAIVSSIYAVDTLYELLMLAAMTIITIIGAAYTIKRFSRESILVSWT